MKQPLQLLIVALLALAMPVTAQVEPPKKKKIAPLNASTEPVKGKIYVVTPAKNRLTVRLDQPIVTADKTNKVVAFHLAESGKITIDGAEGKLEGLVKGMKVIVTPQSMDPSKADKVEATKPAPGEEKKTTETEE
jgi:hypothetical protein